MSQLRKNSIKARAPLAERLAELAKFGDPASKIHGQLAAEGYDVSPRSVRRALLALRGPRRVARRLPATPAPAAAPPVPPAAPAPTEDEIASASLETREEWLKLASRSAAAAEARGDLASVATFGRLATSILESMRKAEQPDSKLEGMIVVPADTFEKGAAEAKHTLESLLNDLYGGPGVEWTNCEACGLPMLKKEKTK